MSDSAAQSDPARSGRVRLACEGVTKGFGEGEGRVVVLEDLDFAVADQEVVCVVGPSGSGKTTLLNLLAGFLEPDGGRVTVDGREVHGPSPERGVVFQQYAVFPWLTVADNIGFGLTLGANKTSAKRRREIVQYYIELMGLTGFENAYMKTLSGGMRQRVAIGRAYAVNPEMLLMDEPFGALDAQTRDRMQEQLLQVMAAEGKTVVFVTHSVEEALFLADRVIVLSARPATVRRVIDVGTPRPRGHEVKTSADFASLRLEVENLLRESDPLDR